MSVLNQTISLKSPADYALVAAAALPLTVVASSPSRAAVGAAVSAILLLAPAARRDWRVWLGLAATYAAWYWSDWQVLDNHVWLMPVWLGAVAVSVYSEDTAAELRRQATVFVTLVFVLALVWKFRSPDFSSGAFFEFTLLTDPRFAPVAQWLGVPAETLASNRVVAAAGPTAGVLEGGEAVRGIAGLLTWGTFVVEGSVAATWGLRVLPDWTRHASLGLFCIITYAIAPVAGFGLILLAMGAAAAKTTTGARAYLAGMAALFVWSAVWNVVVL